MALKGIDWKQFLIANGEKLGLGIFSALGLILLALGLVYSQTAESPDAKKAALAKINKDVDGRFVSAEPADADKPSKERAKLAYAEFKPIPASGYQTDPYFTDEAVASPKRQQPKILQVSPDAKAAVALLALKTLIVDGDDKRGTRILVLKDYKGGAMAAKGGVPGFPGATEGGTGVPAIGAPGMVAGAGVMGKGPAAPIGNADLLKNIAKRAAGTVKRNTGKLGKAKDDPRPIYNAEMVTEQEFEAKGYQPAIDVKAVRVAEIAATFPLKQQMEEYSTRLRLLEGQYELPYFSGVEVERREKLPDGKWSEYKGVDVRKDYDMYRNLSFNQFETDDDRWLDLVQIQMSLAGKPVSPVYWKRPKAVFDGMYPNLEEGLAKVQDRLKQAETSKTLQEQRKKRKSLLDRNEDDDQPGAMTGMAPGGMPGFPGGSPAMAPGAGGFPGGGPGMGLRPGVGAMPGMGGIPGAGGGPASAMADLPPPDDCIIRVMDFTVESGKTYQYRMRVKLRNPNYMRSDVAQESYAKEEELRPDPESWREIPPVTSPLEQFMYAAIPAINEGLLPEADRNKGFLEIHHWVEKTTVGGGDVDVGEWVVVARHKVSRGDFIGRDTIVQGVPTWNRSIHGSDFLHDQSTQAGAKATGEPSVMVNLVARRGTNPVQFILADVEGPYFLHERVERKDGRTSTTRIEDPKRPALNSKQDPDTWSESMILTTDGRLLGRNSAMTEVDPDRKERLKSYDARVSQVKKEIDDIRKSGAPGTPGGTNPFGTSGNN
jgi:hypothetical protein